MRVLVEHEGPITTVTLNRPDKMNGLDLALFQALFVQSNPLPIKAAMARSALLVEEYRLPLCPMDEGPRSDLFQVLETLGL